MELLQKLNREKAISGVSCQKLAAIKRFLNRRSSYRHIPKAEYHKPAGSRNKRQKNKSNDESRHILNLFISLRELFATHEAYYYTPGPVGKEPIHNILIVLATIGVS